MTFKISLSVILKTVHFPFVCIAVKKNVYYSQVKQIPNYTIYSNE